MIEIIKKIAVGIDQFSEWTGRLISWLTLCLVLMQFIIVLGHYIFRVGEIYLQESLLYMHSMIFLGASAYALLHNGHVRVDVFYSRFSEKNKALVNFLGCLFFLFPVIILILWMAWPYVLSSWESLEGSIETSGIQAVYLLKSMILLFACTMFLQAISLLLHSWLTLFNIEHPTEEKPELL
ncbi:MAG: TRAP transporter small permease subunit [Emcibacter sp.]|nr:TRAP transporter small permease subunit [Emcibacter sp.]